jgi:Fe-Mn family superoxide dismutase
MIQNRASRRHFIRTTLLATAGLGLTGKLFAGNNSHRPSIVNPTMPVDGAFKQPDLGYGYGDLEPHIDALTMETHYSKHHAGYVRKLNAAIGKEAKLQGMSLEELLMDVSRLPESVRTSVRNNGGGTWNHAFYWQLMSPNASSTKPSDELRAAMMDAFNDMDNFKQQFKAAATGVFGSGWAWVIKDKEGKLAITGTPNQDNPLMDVAEQRGMPILGIDVWEHAYYLKNKNLRGDYVDAFMKVINWDFVSEMYSK